MSPEIAKLEAATAVFEAKKAGILEAIKHKRRRAQDTAGEERELEALVGHAPVPPLIPRLLYADATPEALAHALVTGWPSGGVLSAEAGALLERAGTLPRGTGFIARFLSAWPGSTQGTRAYRPAPEAMPQVALFGERIRELLAQPLATDAHGCLTPAVLDLSPQARAALAILAERGRARMEEDGRRRAVAINPALLDDRV